MNITRGLVLINVLWAINVSVLHADVLPHSITITDGFLESSPGDSQRYWANPKKNTISKSDLDGRNVKAVLSDLERPYGLSYDKKNQLLVWTSSADEVVRVLSNQGLQYDLTSAFDFPYTIVNSSKESNIAYTLKKNQLVKIIQNKFSDTAKEKILTMVEVSSRGLSFDEKMQTLYIGDKYGRMSYRFDLRTNEFSKLQFQEIEFPIIEISKQSSKKLNKSSISSGDLK